LVWWFLLVLQVEWNLGLVVPCWRGVVAASRPGVLLLGAGEVRCRSSARCAARTGGNFMLLGAVQLLNPGSWSRRGVLLLRRGGGGGEADEVLLMQITNDEEFAAVRRSRSSAPQTRKRISWGDPATDHRWWVLVGFHLELLPKLLPLSLLPSYCLGRARESFRPCTRANWFGPTRVSGSI
jgi:hypothetical protein